jgi:hypothetical protein
MCGIALHCHDHVLYGTGHSIDGRRTTYLCIEAAVQDNLCGCSTSAHFVVAMFAAASVYTVCRCVSIYEFSSRGTCAATVVVC